MAATAEDRIGYGDHPDQFVDMWEPDTEPIGSVVLIHGGYWRQMYDLASTEPLAAHLSGRGWQVANIEYRRVDDRPGVWPEMSADVATAATLVTSRPRIAIGHSAGGHLALWLAAQPGAVDAVMALAPLADLRTADRLQLSTHATNELFGGTADEIPGLYDAASPIELVPLGVPTVVIHGNIDDSVPELLSVNYVEAARDAGDDVVFLAPKGVDHMQVIDPSHGSWRDLDAVLDRWAVEIR